jgi:AcrR family transcriptional regulator
VNDRSPINLTRAQLYRRVWSEPIATVAATLGISGNAVTRICNRLLVPYPPRGYWARKRSGHALARPALPPAPEKPASRLTISSQRARSRRTHRRLTPQARREQLLQVAEKIVGTHGLHAASMKRIAAMAGVSETQAYNYFDSRETLFAELARREFAKIRAAREHDAKGVDDHYERITLTTRAYLREIGRRGDLLLTLLSSAEVRSMLRKERGERKRTAVRTHAGGLVELFGIASPVAFGTTTILTALCLRAGKLIADRRISLEAGERLCLAMVVQGSRDIASARNAGERARRRA